MPLTNILELAALVVGGGGLGWLMKAVVDLYKANRINDRDDFAIAFDRLRSQVDLLITRNEALSTELGLVYVKLRTAEAQIIKLQAFIKTLAQMTADNCPYDDERCPIRSWIRAETMMEGERESG